MHKKYITIACMLALGSFVLPSLSFAEEGEQSNEATTTPIKTISGQELFNNICSHCHTVTYEDSTIGAPGLKGVLERHDEAWLDAWLKNPEAFAKTDEAAKDLIEANRFGLAMPTIPAMQDDAKRQAIIDYLKTLK